MVGKLLKYEFMATRRTFLPLYVALIVVSIFQGIYIQSPAYGVTGILAAVFFSLIIALLVITVVVMIRRFATMLGDEGYLMFTLPVSADALLCSKLIIMFFWIALSAIVGFVCFGIILAGAIPDFLANLSPGLQLLMTELSRIPVHTIILGIVDILIGPLSSILLVYFVVAFSYSGRFGSHKIIAGLVAYIVLSVLLGAIESWVVTGDAAWGLFAGQMSMFLQGGDPSAMNSSVPGVFNTSAEGMQTLSMLFLKSIGFATACIAGLYWATRYFITKELNVE